MLENHNNKIKRQIKKKNRRKEVKLVLLNEEELIQQVCMRPVIYDRSLKGYRKTSLRKQCWNDISKAVESTAEECRKRWRSLRDSFSKHYKVTQRSGETGINKQCKWVFYDQMSFLIPHLDGVSYDLDKLLDEFGDMSEDARSLNSEPTVLNSAIEELEQTELSIETEKEGKGGGEIYQKNLQHSSVSVQATDFVPLPILNTSQSMSINEKNDTTSTAYTKHYHACNGHNLTTNTRCCTESNTDNSSALLDSDEKFLLSCAPTLRRLTHRQNALARLKIQQLLFDIEFDQKNC